MESRGGRPSISVTRNARVVAEGRGTPDRRAVVEVEELHCRVPDRRVSRPLLVVAGVGGEGGADQSLTAAARAGEKPAAERQEADACVRAGERVMRFDPPARPSGEVIPPPEWRWRS